MVSNETQKIKVLHQQFTDLLQTQQARGANAGNMTVEVSAKLGSIKVMLELLLNDRDAVKGSNKSLDSSSSDASKRNEAHDKDSKTAEKSETQPNIMAQPSNGQEQPVVPIDPNAAPRDGQERHQLEQIVQDYQSRLGEMTEAMHTMQTNIMNVQNMQKIQMMNNQMNQNINQFNKMHSQMASITTASHL